MIKLAVTISVAVLLAVALISGINGFLSVDDIELCDGPDTYSSTCAPVDVIVAISGGDTQARVDEAISLYQDGWGYYILFSGAASDKSGPSNAAVMQESAIKKGVPASDIIVEPLAEDTIENAIRTQSLLGNAKRIMLVTSPYHQRRATLEFQKLFGENVTIVSRPTSTDKFWPDTWWMTWSGWWLAISEIIKTTVVVIAS